MKEYKILSAEVYQIFKYASAVAFPALAQFVSSMGTTWNWELAPQIADTLSYIGILMGALIVLDEITSKEV